MDTLSNPKIPLESEEDSVPWIEKYRPDNLGEIISNDEVIGTLKTFIKKRFLPNFIFYGPPGTGKTSAIMASARELYGDLYDVMVLELNASDKRGIETVRTRIKAFTMAKGTSFKSASSKASFRLVVLDEVDAMTKDAQEVLCHRMEKTFGNARYCLICNYLKKIHPNLISRCVVLRFSPLDLKQTRTKISTIVKREKISITPKALGTIIRQGEGDMRKVLNVLQSFHMTKVKSKKISHKGVQKVLGLIASKDILSLLEMLKGKEFEIALGEIEKRLSTMDICMETLLRGIQRELLESILGGKGYLASFPLGIRAHILSELRDIEWGIFKGLSERVQLAALVGMFYLNQPT